MIGVVVSGATTLCFFRGFFLMFHLKCAGIEKMLRGGGVMKIAAVANRKLLIKELKKH